MAKREEFRAMQDAWRAYVDLALGFTEASRKRATKVARRLVGKGGATAEQLQSMAEELLSTSLANRESLSRLVRLELDRALSRVGLATAEEVADLTSRVRDLEQRLRTAEQTAPAPAASPPAAATAATPSGSAAATRAPGGHAQPENAVRPAATKAAPAKVPAKAPAKAPAEAPAKATNTSPAVAKKAVAKKVVAKKTPGGTA
jgi:polyhydroxyalkanoate synthesis regulator phasin